MATLRLPSSLTFQTSILLFIIVLSALTVSASPLPEELGMMKPLRQGRCLVKGNTRPLLHLILGKPDSTMRCKLDTVPGQITRNIHVERELISIPYQDSHWGSFHERQIACVNHRSRRIGYHDLSARLNVICASAVIVHDKRSLAGDIRSTRRTSSERDDSKDPGKYRGPYRP